MFTQGSLISIYTVLPKGPTIAIMYIKDRRLQSCDWFGSIVSLCKTGPRNAVNSGWIFIQSLYHFILPWCFISCCGNKVSIYRRDSLEMGSMFSTGWLSAEGLFQTIFVQISSSFEKGWLTWNEHLKGRQVGYSKLIKDPVLTQTKRYLSENEITFINPSM